jgi:hypothetical protein
MTRLTREEIVMIAAAVADVIVIGWLYVRVGKEEIARQDGTKTLAFYRERATKKPAGCDGPDGLRDRIGESAPTTNNTHAAPR